MKTHLQAPRTAALGQVDLLDVRFHLLSELGAVEFILSALASSEGGWLVNPNLDGLRQWVGDPSVARICGEATLVLADGMSLVWASRLQGTPLPGRVAGSNLIYSLSEAAARAQRSIFLLGGDEGAAAGAARALRERYPALVLAGTHCPPFGFEQDEHEQERIRSAVLAARPDIVYVALGLPKQERLIHELRPLLPQAWWLGVGISFSFVCGSVKRAPPWMQSAGLEWLHRLAQEPWRLGRRYLVQGPPFALRLAASCGARRLRGRAGL